MDSIYKRAQAEFEATEMFVEMHNVLRQYMFGTNDLSKVSRSPDEILMRAEFAINEISNLMVGHMMTLTMNGGHVDPFDVLNDLNEKIIEAGSGMHELGSS